jgi:hypothetical protein
VTRDIRLTDGERATMIDALRIHLADGRITMEEFEHRAGIVYSAKLQSDADDAFAELPPPPAGGLRAPARTARGRHGESEVAKPHWHATSEIFRDPTTGRVMRVWVDPTDGSRHYIAG